MKWNALTKVLRYGGWGVLCSCQGVTNTGYQPQGEVSAKAQARKIIFIMTDTHRWDMLSSITPEIKTPNLDRLAEEGVRFDRAYTCFPGEWPCPFGYIYGIVSAY